MAIQTSLTRLLGLEHPIIQAPMAGGATTVDLVAAVCRAGALGSFGAAYDPPERIVEHASRLRERTGKPFAINLFAPLPEPAAGDPSAMIALVSAYHEELGLPPPAVPKWAPDTFEEKLEAVLEVAPAVLSFTFGTIPPSAMEALHERGILVMGTATTVDEALTLEQLGVDAVVAQGSEAGGHRGTFGGPFESGLVGTMALVPAMADALGIPVVASGGIMDGRGVAAALALGAQSVQMGTAFLTCHEAGVPEAHKEAILTAREDSTRVTRAFSGRPARGVRNRFMDEIEAAAEPLPFPLQNSLTRGMRKAAARAGRGDLISLWSGQGVRLGRRTGAAELVAAVAAELEATISRLGSGTDPGVAQALRSPAVDE
ncbi:MAG TPA: nitronate monooxygenase [Trueperaceae bacterium]